MLYLLLHAAEVVAGDTSEKMGMGGELYSSQEFYEQVLGRYQESFFI
jgi:hypothetical protein